MREVVCTLISTCNGSPLLGHARKINNMKTQTVDQEI